MDVKLTRSEVRRLAGACAALGETKEKLPFSIVYAANRTRMYLKPLLTEIHDELDAAERTSKKLSLDFCLRGTDGKPVYTENKQFCGLELGLQPEYDAGIEKLNNDMQHFMSAQVVVVKIHSIKMQDIPADLPTDLLNKLCLLVEEYYNE
jgi:hypothetical protein